MHLVTGAGIEVDVLPSIWLRAEYMHVFGQNSLLFLPALRFEEPMPIFAQCRIL